MTKGANHTSGCVAKHNHYPYESSKLYTPQLTTITSLKYLRRCKLTTIDGATPLPVDSEEHGKISKLCILLYWIHHVPFDMAHMLVKSLVAAFSCLAAGEIYVEALSRASRQSPT